MRAKKKELILKAAFEVFIRHGYRRATMGEIAEEAEISRPAVYLEFANKEAVFRAMLLHYYEQRRARAAQRLRSAATLRERLGVVLQVWSVEIYERLNGSPEGRDLRLRAISATSDVRHQGLRMFEDQVDEAIRRSTEVEGGAVDGRALDLPLLAPLIVASSRGLEQAATSQQQLKRLLDTMIEVLAAALGTGEARPRPAARRRAG